MAAHLAEGGRNPFYKLPGYEATFLATLEQRAEIAISLCQLTRGSQILTDRENF